MEAASASVNTGELVTLHVADFCPTHKWFSSSMYRFTLKAPVRAILKVVEIVRDKFMETLRRLAQKKVKRISKWNSMSPKERRHKLVGQPQLWKMKRDFQIQFLTQMGLQPEDNLIDIGCGTLRGGIPIIRYLEAGHYAGIESRNKAMSEGKKELEESGLQSKNPALIVNSNLASLNLERRADYIWAFSVLFHMKDDVARDCLNFVARYLEDDGCFYANVNVGAKKEGRWQGFPVVWRTLDFYENCASDYGLRVEDIGELGDFGHFSGIAEQDRQRMLKISKC